MVDNSTVMESGRCIECGARETHGYSCYELFGFPLVWEHNDPKLYGQHFWLVSCYMIQHPSNYTEKGYKHLVSLFIDAYDNAGGKTWTRMDEHIIELLTTSGITVAEYAQVSGMKDMQETATHMLASES